jgi:hypothetical protein
MPQSKSSPAELEIGPLLRVLPRERAVVLRATIANVDKHWVAERAQAAGLAGTVSDGSLGFGDWGVESSLVVECATRVVTPFRIDDLKVNFSCGCLCRANPHRECRWLVSVRTAAGCARTAAARR